MDRPDFLETYEFDPEGSTCTECGDSFGEVDEATELCDMCFEHVFGADNEGSIS